MNEEQISQLCVKCFSQEPDVVKRCAMGIGNYVYYVECGGEPYIFRCSNKTGAYQSTIHWLNALNTVSVPVPRVIRYGSFDSYDYLILSYLEGADIGLVYPQLSAAEKRDIAREIIRIQNQAALLEMAPLPSDWSWSTFVQDILNRAKERIAKNGYFDVSKVERLREQAAHLESYFSSIQPVPYLDDISSKNLIIHKGRISGIIDVDWIGAGDKLTYVALTNMALLDLGYDTDYVTYILEEMRLTAQQQNAFLFYTLMYCVDFMGERGMRFMDKTVAVNPQIIDKLNGIYDLLWIEWNSSCGR